VSKTRLLSKNCERGGGPEKAQHRKLGIEADNKLQLYDDDLKEQQQRKGKGETKVGEAAIGGQGKPRS